MKKALGLFLLLSAGANGVVDLVVLAQLEGVQNGCAFGRVGGRGFDSFRRDVPGSPCLATRRPISSLLRRKGAALASNETL